MRPFNTADEIYKFTNTNSFIDLSSRSGVLNKRSFKETHKIPRIPQEFFTLTLDFRDYSISQIFEKMTL